MKDITELYNELKENLQKSTHEQRKAWALIISEKQFSLKPFSKLLECKPAVPSRFLWLLSDVGNCDSKLLYNFLPYLLELRKDLGHIKTEASFANLWLIAGVPEENEAQAIDLLFNWLQSSDTNVTTKSRSLFVLFNLANKYPDLKQELKLSLIDQMDKYSSSFQKRASKILHQLEL